MSHAAKAHAHHPEGSRVHGAGVLREAQHDAYRLRAKLPGGTRCPECHAEVHRGRWTWAPSVALAPTGLEGAQLNGSGNLNGRHRGSAVTEEARAPAASAATGPKPPPRAVLCPACRRQREGQAAAEIDLTGRYVAEHEAALLALVQRIASRELAEHPLERLMQLERVGRGHLHLRTTGLHLPRALGHALERSHHGELAQHYAPDSLLLRLRWHRDS
jgi:hypothetical protein